MSGLPPEIAAEIEAELERTGRGAVRSITRVGGGCISPSARLECTGGNVLFVKWSEGSSPPDFFTEEARSLRALGAAGAVRVPRVHAVRERWLLLEWLEAGAPTARGWAALGASLADQHSRRADRFGWESDNYIGSLPQENRWTERWGAFWRDRRLLPQLERARAAGAFDRGARARFDRLLDRLADMLSPGDDDGASLLHGDLWSGNVHFLSDGSAATIDPSSYYGHREVDLAMAALFGGFPRTFFESYAERWPLLPGAEERRPVYQLYYLLVHVNLFGGSYVDGTLRALAAAERSIV